LGRAKHQLIAHPCRRRGFVADCDEILSVVSAFGSSGIAAADPALGVDSHLVGAACV